MLPHFPKRNRLDAKDSQPQNEANVINELTLLEELSSTAPGQYSDSSLALLPTGCLGKQSAQSQRLQCLDFLSLSGFQTHDHPHSSSFSSSELDIQTYSNTVLSQENGNSSLSEKLSRFQGFYLSPK